MADCAAMTVLEINGQHVDVDDGFMKLSPEDQTKTVNEIAGHLGQPADAGFDRNDPSFKNEDTRALIRGVPVVGPLVANKLAAGVRTAFNGGTYEENLRQEDAAQKAFEAEHPVLDAVSQGIGGTLALGGVGGAVPGAARVLGMTGKVLPAMRNAALSGAAISGADAVARGEDPSAAAAIGGLTGPAGVLLGKGAGKAFDAISEGVRGRPAVPTRFMDVNGEQVPIRESVETGSPDTSRTEQALLRAGQPAAVQGEEATQTAMAKAHSDLAAGLDPTATSPSATPLQAGDAVAGDLVSQEQARAAAEVARTQAAIADTAGIRGSLDVPGQPVAPHAPLEAAQAVSSGIRDRFTAARAGTRAAYEAAGQVPGEFNPKHLLGAGEDIRMHLNSAPGNDRVRISSETTPAAANALRTIDDEISQLRFTNDAAHGARTVRGFDAPTAAQPAVVPRRPAGEPLSLLQFIASRGGLIPHPELDAIGLASGHRAQIPGQSGFFGVVRKNGANIDRMREAAQEAGYFRGHGEATSTPTEFLDAIDAELRGHKRYPEGFEGHVTKREGVVRGAREQAEYDQVNHGFERDLRDAGHGELGGAVKERAVTLMRDEGMHPDEAVDRALMQLEQEDSAGAGSHGSFPGDSARVSPPAGTPSSGRPITAADMEQVRKQLVIQRRIANNAARTTGNWEDSRAMGRVIQEFDNWLGRTVKRPSGFSGDSAQYLQTQAAARAAHTQERAAFSRRGPGDQVGSMMENIVGKYPGQEMSPEKIIRTVLGSPDSPGGAEHAVAALGHLRDTLGPQSPEWAALRKAAISHFTEPAPGGEAVPLTKQADRMLKFLGNERHSGQIFDAGERARLEAHAQTLRGAEDAPLVTGTMEEKIAKLSGRKNGEPATGEQTLAAIKKDPRLAEEVMKSVSPESRSLLKQALWQQISEAPEGMIKWENQKTGQSIAKFLNTDLARAVYTPNERMLMKAIADAHQRLVPIPGTTNPAGTAHMLAKLVSGGKHQLLGLFGFHAGGLPGAATAIALGKGLEWIGAKRAANQATRLFLGQQPKAPGVRFPQAIGAISGQLPSRKYQN